MIVLWAAMVALFASPALAAVTIDATPNFLPAEAGRTHMDIGGVFDGSMEVTPTAGDGFTIQIANSGNMTAFDLTLSVALPDHFSYIPNSAQGIAGITASQSGNTLTFNVPANTNINSMANVTVGYELNVDETLPDGGTFQLDYTIGYGTTNGATDGSAMAQQNVLVQAGESTLVIDPLQQTASVGQGVSWQITVSNTGLGGLYDVVIDETALNPNAANSLQITDMTEVTPGGGASESPQFVFTLPYLAPGDDFVIDVDADVIGCDEIENDVQTTDRTGRTDDTQTASITLDLQEAMIAISPPAVTLDYGETVSVTVDVDSTGAGDVYELALTSNINTLGLDITNVGGGWAYDSGSGTFTYDSANNGFLAMMASADLTFDVAAADWCAGGAGGLVVWTADYVNGCDDPFMTPTELSNISGASDAPSVTVDMTNADNRIEVGSSGQFTVSVSAANLVNINDDPIAVTIVFPDEADPGDEMSNIVVTPPGSAPSVSCTNCDPGDTLTWNVPHSALGGGAIDLVIDFTAPTNPCEGGEVLSLMANMSADTSASCTVSDNGSSGILLINNPDTGVVQNFEVADLPSGEIYETGLASQSDPVRDQNEGEFIPVTASYEFGAGFNGVWTGSTYTDDFSSFAGQTLVNNSITVTVDGNPQTFNIGSQVGSLSYDLSNIRTDFGLADDNVAGHTLIISYETTVPDSDLTGTTTSTTQRSQLTIQGGGGQGECSTTGGTFTQGDFLTIGRAAATVAVGIPSQINVCEEFDAALTVSNSTAEDASNIVVTLNTEPGDAYEFIGLQATPYGGAFNAGNITFDNSGDSPTWRLCDAELTGQGQIFIRVRRRGQSGTANTALTADIDYDDNQTFDPAACPGEPTRDFSGGGSDSPVLVREGALALTTTPQTVTVTGDQITWRIYLTNTGNGIAYNTVLTDTLPAGLNPNVADTNAANPAYPLQSPQVGQDLVWNIGDIASGAQVQIDVVVDVDMSIFAGDCSIDPNAISAEWGCGSEAAYDTTSADPAFEFLQGKMQIVHDTTNTRATLCDDSTAIIIVKNTGLPHVFNVEVSEVLNPGASGLDFVAGSTEVSTDGMNYTALGAGGNPSGAGTDASPYVWTKNEISQLADLAPQSAGGVDTVYIRFGLSSNETASTSGASITASGSGDTACGEPVSSLGTPFAVPVEQPDITVFVTGRNVTQGQMTFVEEVAADPNDEVEWRIEIQNTGDHAARNVVLTDTLAQAASGDITGPDPGNGDYNSTSFGTNDNLPISDIAAGSSAVYLVREDLGATCSDGTHTASVVWGCGGSALSSPSDNSDTADLKMLPDFGGSNISQSFSRLSGGRVEVRITITNTGDRADNLVLTDTLPDISGDSVFLYDTTFTPTLNNNSSSITAVSVNATDLSQPVFTFTGHMDQDDSVQLRFRTYPDDNFDTTSDALTNPETTGNGFDPDTPSTETNAVSLAFDTSCGSGGPVTNNRNLNPRTPDLDFTLLNPPSAFVADGEQYTFEFTVTNAGENNSIADNIDFRPTLGNGWTVDSVTVTPPGGSETACPGGDCTPAQIGNLDRNEAALFKVTATVNRAGGNDLSINTEVEGSVHQSDGTDTGNNYSLDAAAVEVVGFELDKSRQATSESATTAANVAIGEEITWRLRAEWFGSEDISSITLRDTLPTGLSFISQSATGANTAGYTPNVSGQDVDFAVTGFTGTNIFEVDLVTRVLNDPGGGDTTGSGDTLTNNFDAQYTTEFVGGDETFASAEFGGSDSELNDSEDLTIVEPQVTIDTTVSRDPGPFIQSVTAAPGDVLIYQFVIENDAAATGPAFNLVFSETFPEDLTLDDPASDGIDNDGDGDIDGADTDGEGVFTFGANPTASITGAHNSALDQLDPGESVTILLKTTLDISASPSETVTVDADILTSSLSTVLGSQTAPGDANGERIYADSDDADAVVDDVTFGKSILNTAVGGDTSLNVLVGEQVQFELRLVLPAGTVNNFTVTDMLPENLVLLSQSVSLGSSIQAGAPTFTPAVLPASGSGGDLTATWDFGTREVQVDSVQANRTVVITYIAQVRNIALNQDSVTITNDAMYSFNGSPANMGEVTLTVREPLIAAITNTVAPGGPVDAGQVLTYTVSIPNTGNAIAYDLNITDLMPAGTSYVANSTTVTVGPALGEPEVDGQQLIWGRDQDTPQDVDLPDGQTLTFTYQVLVGNTVEPGQTLQNDVDVDWTSLDGAPGPNLGTAVLASGNAQGERNGDGAANDYAQSDDTTLSVSNTFTTTKTASGDTVTGGGFRIGDLITYTIELDIQEGTIDAAVIEDVLPDGLEFDSFDAITPATGADGFTYTAPTGGNAPSTGDAGTLQWTIGTITNAGDPDATNDTLTLVYRARITDDATEFANTPTTQQVSNSALLRYEDSGGASQATTADVETSDIKQPQLVLALDGPAMVDLGDPGDFAARVENVGDAPAYQPTIEIELPDGMRDTDPTTLPLSLDITGGRTLTLAQGTDYTVAYTAGTGRLVFTLISAAAFIDAPETLTINFDGGLDADADDMTNLALSATTTTYTSQDESAGPATESRAYPTTFAAGTTGTANSDPGDDPTDDHMFIGEAPVLAFTKSVDLATASPSDTLHYQITVTNNGSSPATGIEVSDDLPAEIEPGTLANLIVTPAAGTVTFDDTGGVNNTGTFTVSGLTLAVGNSITIDFDADLRDIIPSGTIAANQATLNLDGFSVTLVSDSTNAADNNGVEEGNAGADPDDDDPVRTTIVSAPQIIVSKTDTDLDGAPLEVGDTLRYTITINNTGDEHAVNVAAQDAIPANTQYVVGSTTLNGSAVADIDDLSPLVGGMAVNSPGAGAGNLNVNEPATITFEVTLAAAAAGSAIYNQAVVTGEGEGSGAFTPVPSDDPDTTTTNDPTATVVGDAPLLDVTKTVADLNAADLQPGETLRYTITIENRGNADASSVVFTDPIPTNTTYANASLFLQGGGLSDADDADAGDFNSTAANAVTVNIGDLAAGATRVITFDVTVVGGVASGTVITNQGRVSADALPDELTDVDGNDANGDQPTPIIVGSAPALRLEKSVVDLNGGLLQPGDALEYVLNITNIGSAAATNVVITDPVPPANTTYVAASTRLGAATLADNAGASPLVAGVNIGAINPGAARALRFQVAVSTSATPGTSIDNQATFAADGGLSGVSDSSLNDNLETGNEATEPNDDDPTRLQVGNSPTLANLAGRVFLDLNHDNMPDPDEPPRAGWRVELLRDGVVVATAIADENGEYEFVGLPPGDGYSLWFRHPQTNVVYGGPATSAPGATTDVGTIDNLTLSPGTTVIEQNLPLDPSGVIYDAITREPIPGVIITIAGPPGFDPVTQTLPGQAVQTTGDDGYYRFDLYNGFPSPGIYTLELTIPNGYLPNTSSIIPPQPGFLDATGQPDPFLVQAQSDPPQGNQPTTYYLVFELENGDPNVINNHIPLDPILDDAIIVRKTTPRVNVSRGDLVPYAITATNNTIATLTDIELRDLLPPGFKYVDGSATLDDAEATVTVDNRMITWPAMTFAPGQERTLSLIAVIGSGVGEGRYTNQAWAFNVAADTAVSSPGEATVRVIPDPTFDVSDLIGKVFYDRDADGYQDEGEPGVAHARVVTATGLLVTTDVHGRYHIAAAAVPHESRGSNFIVKLDPRSLPSGYRITTENPRVVRLTRGKVTKANFGVTVSRVIRLDVTDAVFHPAFEDPLDGWLPTLDQVATLLDEQPSALRIAYLVDDPAIESALIDARLNRIIDLIHDRRQTDVADAHARALIVETEVVRADAPDLAERLNTLHRRLPPLREADDQSDADVSRKHQVLNALSHDVVDVMDAPPNTELARGAASVPSPFPYRITVDGAVVSDAAALPVDAQRQSDLALQQADVKLRFDPEPRPRVLNVTSWPNAAVRSEPVTFTAYSNYRAYITRAEVRLFETTQSPRNTPMHVLPIERDDYVRWSPPADTPDEIRFVLRVYDDQGRFDETEPKRLRVNNRAHGLPDPDSPQREQQTGYGENHVAIANIPVEGGAIVVNADDLPPDTTVRALGSDIPVDANGSFAAEQILPPGAHIIDLDIADASGEGVSFERQVYIPDEDWFYVAIADLTVGGNRDSGPAPLVTGDDEVNDPLYFNGRLAFYVKGKLKGDWLLTASGDTREGDISDMFSNFNEDDPRSLLRRLDADRFYPVYGDDSTLVEDAPTNGKLYVRVERGDSHIMWGNFYTRILDTDLAQIDRALYGGKLHLVSDEQTGFGDPRTVVDAFAAQPETTSAREEFRGTGGSLYFLRHQDILNGSERVRIETRDKDSGIVLSTRTLTPYEDYDIDPIQGRIMLSQPLASTGEDDLLVNTGTLSGHPQFLIVRYEYSPAFTDLDDFNAGGRVAHWLNDHVKVGVTAARQDQDGGDQDLLAGDVTIRFTPESYVKAEVSHTDGPGVGELQSFDGGFNFFAVDQVNDPDIDATAYRVEGALSLADLLEDPQQRGRITAYYEDRERGFSAPGQLTPRDVQRWGLDLHSYFQDRTEIRFKYDERQERGGIDTRAFNLDLLHDFSDRWYAGVGVRHDDVTDNSGGALFGTARDGSRTDAQLRLGYRSQHDDWEAYIFGQATLESSDDRVDNDRFGIGGSTQLTDKLAVNGEVSEGDGGFGALVGADYLINDRTSVYYNVESSTDRTDTGYRGRTTSFTQGIRSRYDDEISVYMERRMVDADDAPSGLTHAFGLDLAPEDQVTIGFSFENGRIEDRTIGELDRTAAAISFGYSGEVLDLAHAMEWRKDLGDREDRETWLFRNSASLQTTPDWRAFAKFNLATSDSSRGDFFDGDFIEAVLGAAYRPVDNDRLNVLFKYTYFEDLPSPGQVNRANLGPLFQQRSHILSADATYDLTEHLSIGGKYGLRIGEVRDGRESGEWFDSTAHLLVGRLDVHVVKNWDALIEGRFLRVEEADDYRAGALIGVYRHINDNLKFGLGYNFADFSDDLTDLDYDHEGWFINIVAKF